MQELYVVCPCNAMTGTVICFLHMHVSDLYHVLYVYIRLFV